MLINKLWLIGDELCVVDCAVLTLLCVVDCVVVAVLCVVNCVVAAMLCVDDSLTVS